MKLPISWLNEYVNTKGITPAQIADKLVSVGFEVEEIIYMGEGIDNVVTGKILEINKHPDADKLVVCKVDVGTEVTTIVTGANNIKCGDIVPVALDGATLPGGVKITAAPLRGVMSYGMMCSGKELGVDDSVIEGAEVHGILILPKSTKVGKDIKQVLRLDDTVLDISITANRPDCQSIYGIAREIAAVLGKPIKPLNIKYTTVVNTQFNPTVKITDSDCSRYTCQVISDVKIKKSPDWMRDRLRMVGVRPINNVVDITNYVLFEVGQPLHAFDTKQVSNLGIIVRKAAKGEIITALDEKQYTLNENMTVIADCDKPLAIAGVMGGSYSGISDETTSVLLESARFAKGSVRTTSRTLGLRSDSSARYEKGVDYGSIDVGRERALTLFSELKAGVVTSSKAEDGIPQPKQKVIKTSIEKICGLLGIKISGSVITKILKSLCFDVTNNDGKLTVKVPVFREDIDNYSDLAEEVIRYYGYDNIVSTFMPTAKCTAGGLDVRQHNLNAVKSIVSGLGAYEITTYSFIGKKCADKLNLPSDSVLRRQIEILNPLSEEYSLMRTQLAHSMLSVVANNLNKKNKNFRLFELSKTYIPHALPLTELPEEHDTLIMAFTGGEESFYTIKYAANEVLRKLGITPTKYEYSTKPYYHPGVSCDYYYGENVFCSFGKLHPSVAANYNISQDVYICEIDLYDFIEQEAPSVKFEPLPKFQSAERDLAVIVKEEVPVGELVNAVKSADELCYDAELFDIYRGEQIEQGYKSVALSFTLSAPDRTLTEEEINAAVKNILDLLTVRFDAKLR